MRARNGYSNDSSLIVKDLAPRKAARPAPASAGPAHHSGRVWWRNQVIWRFAYSARWR